MTRVLTRIVLASASPRRLELLRGLGVQVDVEPSAYDEPGLPGLSPAALASRHAAAKLADVLARHPGAAVVAADTVVDLDGRALGKPRDAAEAAAMLAALSGRRHLVHTGFALGLPGLAPHEECSTTTVQFYPLDTAEIDAYVASGEPFDKAGGYGIQGRAASFVESIDGDFYTVMGFPVARFVRALRRLGWSLPPTTEKPGK
jgi:septum formation protein